MLGYVIHLCSNICSSVLSGFSWLRRVDNLLILINIPRLTIKMTSRLNTPSSVIMQPKNKQILSLRHTSLEALQKRPEAYILLKS